MLKVPEEGERGRSLSLAELPFSFLSEGDTEARKHRLALEKILEACSRIFDAEEHMFQEGQRLLHEVAPPAGTDPASRAIIARALRAEMRSLGTTSRSQFSPCGKEDPETLRLKSQLRNAETWRAAGVRRLDGRPIFPKRKRGPHHWELQVLLGSMLGATHRATSAVMIAFCCHTAWNKQPIIDLPQQYITMRTENCVFVGQKRFIASFKRRAGHYVVADLEKPLFISGEQAKTMAAAWREVGKGYGGRDKADGWAELAPDSSIIRLLARYEAMTDAVRQLDGKKRLAGQLFVYVSFRAGVMAAKSDFAINESLYPLKDETLSVPGFGLRAIRKSVLRLLRLEKADVAGVSQAAGHSGTVVTIRNYLKGSSTIAAAEARSIRMFQNTVQVLLVRGKPQIAALVGLKQEEIDYFETIAKASGLEATLGLEKSSRRRRAVRHRRFIPTPSSLRGLFLAHVAVTKARDQTTMARWVMQALPIRGVVKGIVAGLRAEGFMDAYRREARKASEELKSGRPLLPPVLLA